MQVHRDHQGDSVLRNIRTESSFSLASTASDSDFEKSSATVFEKNSSQFNDTNQLEDNEEALKEALAGYHHLIKIPEDVIHATIVSMVDCNTMLPGMRKALLDREMLKENLADYQYRLFEKYSVNPSDLVKLEKLLYVTVGDVFRVFNKRNRRFYLLKEIKRQEFQKQSQFEAVCWIEIQNLLKVRELNDPTLMRIYYVDFDEEGETCNILVEVTFGRLWEYASCMKYYGLEWKEEDLEYILSQLLSQVLKLKSIGMHHRDIRPKHILISYKHEGIKFGYYGCGCITEPGVQKLDIVGTPHYMAPELISAIMRREQFAEYDPYLSDLFSVGVTMLMVIEPDLKRKNISDFLENVVKPKYPGLYPTLKDLLGHPLQRNEGVQKFLAKDIRIQSCAEFEARTVGDRYKVFLFQRIMTGNKQIKTSLYFDMCILDHVLLIIKKKIDLLTQDKNPQDQNLEEVIWRIKLARCYYMQMNYECALKELLEIIQRKELRSFDTPNSLAKAKTLLWLGVVKEKLGRKTDCVANLMQCLGRRVAEFGEVHKSIIEVLWHLGDIKVGQEDFVGAKKAFHKCIEIGEQLDSKQRKYMAKGLYSLGVLAGLRDEHEEALKLFERGKEIAILVHGEFHPAVADQLLAIGNTYIILGRSEEGLDLYEGALATKIRWYGENNPEIAVTYTKIARGYNRMGKYKKALEYLEKSVEIWRKVEDEESQELADVYQLIGSVLCKKGNYSKSLDYANKVIKSKETTFGKNHPWLAGTYVWRAEICSALGLESEKQKSLKDFLAIDFDKAELNIDNSKIGFRAVGLFAEEGNIEKAQEYLQKAYQMCIDLAVPKTAKTYSCYCEALGRLRMAEGKLGEALEAIKEALHIRDCLPCQDPDVETGLYNIMGELYEALENNQEALSCRRKSMEMVEKYLGSGSLLMLKTLINLSKALQKIGKHEEAREKLSAAQQLIEGLKVPKHHPLFQKCIDLQIKLEGRQINI